MYKWLLFIATLPVWLMLLALALFYVAPIQQLVVKRGLAYISQETGKKIVAEQLSLTFPLQLQLKKGAVIAEKDTLLQVEDLQLSIAFWPLLQQKVALSTFQLRGLTLHTQQELPGMELNGTIGALELTAHSIDLLQKKITINHLHWERSNIEGYLLPVAAEKEEEDSSAPWSIELLQGDLQAIRAAVHLPKEKTEATIDLTQLTIEKAQFNGATQQMGVAAVSLESKQMSYQQAEGKRWELSNWGIHLQAVTADTLAIQWEKIAVETRYSKLTTQGVYYLKESKKRTSHLLLEGHCGVKDWTALLDTLPIHTPEAPIYLAVKAHGNLQKWELTDCKVYTPDLFTLTATGNVAKINTPQQTGELELTASYMGEDLAYASLLLPQQTLLTLKAEAKGKRYKATTQLQEREGTALFSGEYNGTTDEYTGMLNLRDLNLGHFLPTSGMGKMRAQMELQGKGHDLLHKKTLLHGKGSISAWEYQGEKFDTLAFALQVKEQQATFTCRSLSPQLDFVGKGKATLLPKKQSGEMELTVHQIDWKKLALQTTPLTTSFHCILQVEQQEIEPRKALQAVAKGTKKSATMDMAQQKQRLKFIGSFDTIQIHTSEQKYTPEPFHLELNLAPKGTKLALKGGDLQVDFQSKEQYNMLLNKLTTATTYLQQHLSVQQDFPLEFTKQLPHLSLTITAQQENFLHAYLATINTSFEQFSAQLELSPTTGIQGFFQVDQLKKETQQLHMLRGEIQQDSLGIELKGEADNGNLEQPHNSTTKTPHFKALLQGRLEKEAGELLVTYLNEQQDTTFHIGVDAKKQAGKYRFSLFPANPVLFEERFTLNDSNQVVFEQEHPIHASVELLDKKGRGVRFYSASNSDATQDLALELREIELADVAKLLPQSIKMKGILTTELHYMQQEKMHIMASDISIDSLVYNHYPMGNISLTTDYMPQSLQEHFIDSHLSINDKEALSLTGSYLMKGEELEGNMELKQLPLQLINAFVEQSVATATGFLNGKMEVKGPLSALVSNGEVSFEKSSFKSEMLGSQFYLTDRPVTVKKNQLLFDHFTLHGENNSPFSIKGNIDFNHLEQPIIDLKLTANDYELLHAKKKKRSMLYGKMYIDVDATLKGALDNLAVKGNIQLLGKTDATYVLTESALTVENRLDDLVTFTNFNDTLSTKKEAEKEYQLGGLHMLLHVQIERGTHLNVDIDKNSYLKAEGGGELTLQYTPQGDLLFNGRYAFTSGEMKYSLPIIPLKTFTIQNGSYVEWMGNPMDPNLSIVATELISAKVTRNELPRMVDFEVGVGISNKLSNIGLTFVINAPESATLQNDLATLSADQRNKQAITLLATGIYLGSGNAQQKIDVNDALNSFLQTEISSMAKSALKTVDISFGMETVEGETTDEAAHTDYSFRFAKRFWNNRLNVIIGGRISTGTDRQTQSFIDDVTLEWRLDTSGTRYVTLFHKKNYDDILDSEITETGVGLVLRKKIDRLSELFIFKKKRKEQVQIEKKELEKEKNSKK